MCPTDAHCHRHRRKDLRIPRITIVILVQGISYEERNFCPNAGKYNSWILSCECSTDCTAGKCSFHSNFPQYVDALTVSVDDMNIEQLSAKNIEKDLRILME